MSDIKDVSVRWSDGYLEEFKASEVRAGNDLLWMVLVNGQNRHIPLRTVRWFSITPERELTRAERLIDEVRSNAKEPCCGNEKPIELRTYITEEYPYAGSYELLLKRLVSDGHMDITEYVKELESYRRNIARGTTQA
jgi:hypothetical protein